MQGNALVHGAPAGRGFLLGLTLHDDGVHRVEVHDSGPGEVRTPETSPDAEHGRGLLLVAALADKWGVGERNPGKVVWCEFHSLPGRADRSGDRRHRPVGERAGLAGVGA
ncbi:ATP-binding protein [Streptomyces sp. NPDC053069]|uniref:ATP-binding protein n=1 Tax=Streptomyces sp. NPDC053069 TaxID=3365695 RepID=UPI0037D73EB8